ncbi:hypothetical protein BCR44DRAFT_1460055 [Catenaria anguillulae PL171]|uniref:Secreted protein n=1 Tax=Catenaria anguillulae PL171 TaxID=765915 RepID=A0A1Y2HRA2_9FUNG|nr:hypothetical protein BCR44DRAFT_1460055 [Catenaria anguillulae PL171]
MTAPTAILTFVLLALVATQVQAAAVNVSLDKRDRGCSDQPYFHADLPHAFDAGFVSAGTWEECYDQGRASGHKGIVYRYDQQRCYFKSFPVNGAKTYYCGRREPYHYDVAGFDVAKLRHV